MNKHPAFNRILDVLVLVGLVIVVYLLWARPYQLRWGATDEEVQTDQYIQTTCPCCASQRDEYRSLA